MGGWCRWVVFFGSIGAAGVAGVANVISKVQAPCLQPVDHRLKVKHSFSMLHAIPEGAYLPPAERRALDAGTMRKIWIRICGVACSNREQQGSSICCTKNGRLLGNPVRKHASKSSRLGKSTTAYDRMDAPHIVSCHFGVTHFGYNDDDGDDSHTTKFRTVVVNKRT